jgi:hypothetical protein
MIQRFSLPPGKAILPYTIIVPGGFALRLTPGLHPGLSRFGPYLCAIWLKDNF